MPGPSNLLEQARLRREWLLQAYLPDLMLSPTRVKPLGELAISAVH